MRIVGGHEDLIAEYGETLVCPQRGIANEPRGGGARIMPDLAASDRIDCEDLIGAGEVHDPFGDEWCGFDSEMRDGKDPLHPELLDVPGVDLVEFAVAVAADVPVVG